MATATRLMTVEEFMALVPASDGRQELHHGQLVEMRPAKFLHTLTQRSIIEALHQVLDQRYLVEKEFPFRPTQEYEARVADVAVLDRARARSTPLDQYFSGVPEIVVEVLSPTNSASEMLDREAICLGHGGREFWLCDPVRQTVKVTTAAGFSRLYRLGDTLPLGEFGAPIAVADLFSPL